MIEVLWISRWRRRSGIDVEEFVERLCWVTRQMLRCYKMTNYRDNDDAAESTYKLVPSTFMNTKRRLYYGNNELVMR